MEKNTIHKGDCLEFLKDIPDNSVDLGLTDCPYKIKTGGARVEIEGEGENIYKKTDPKGCLSRGLKVKDKLKSKWLKQNDKDSFNLITTGGLFEHNTIKFKDWLPEFYRVLKKGSHAYIMINSQNLKDLQLEAEKVGFIFQNLIIWEKGNFTPNKYYMQGAEFILMLRKGKAKNINDMGMGNILKIPNIIGNKLHPTEKPVALNKILIKQSSNEGDLILDPFMGSGSTAIACIETNRRFIGAEIDENYYTKALERIKKHMPQLSLF